MTSAPTVAPAAHESVWALTTASFASRALTVVADLGIADLIDAGPVDVATLAEATGSDAASLHRVLRLLAAHGIFRPEAGGYEHTDASRLLRSDHPMGLRAFPRMIGLPVLWQSVGALPDTVRTGTPGVERVDPRGFFAYLQDHPLEARIFGQAMTAKACGDVAAVLDAYDFHRFQTIADIGGGRGHLLRSVLDAAPESTGVLFDLPHVVDSYDLGTERLETVGGDFFQDPLPTADAYLLMEVLHDWPDDRAVAILRGIRSAAQPGARLLVIEGLAADVPDPRVQTLDLIMLCVTGGRERTLGEHQTLLREAGFELTRAVRTAGPLQVLEAVLSPSGD